MTSARPTIELNADLEHRIEQLAALCPHTPEPCDVCTAKAVWAVEALVDTGWYTQIRRFQSRPPQGEQVKPPEGTTIHLCPPKGAAVCPCCGKTPFELPLTDRITAHVHVANCAGEASPGVSP